MPSVILNTTQTTFVSSAQPANNFSLYPLMFAGSDAVFGTCVSFIKFSLPKMPVAAVDSAYLKLSVIVKTGTDPSLVVINRVTSPLDTSTVAYITQPTYIATATEADVTQADLYTAVTFDVTTLVNQWVSGLYDNHGFALSNAEGTTVVQFAANNIVYQPYFPRLVLNYTSTAATHRQDEGEPTDRSRRRSRRRRNGTI